MTEVGRLRMWVVPTMTTLLLASAGCGTTAPAPSGGGPKGTASGSPGTTPALPSPSALPPASPRTAPLALEACGEVTHNQDGSAGPALCPDGSPSLATDRYLRSLEPALAILHVAPDANLEDVETAMCADKTFAHMTNPGEESAYRLMAAEQGWRFGDEPVTWLAKQPC